MRWWVFESIESCSNNNQMILKYIKNSVRALVNTIIKWNNNDAMKWGKRVRGYEIFYMYRAANNKNAHKKENNKMGKCHWKCLYGFQLNRGWGRMWSEKRNEKDRIIGMREAISGMWDWD